jgi:hypothetical protein
MADLRRTLIAENNRDNIKTHRFVFDLVLPDEMFCGIADPPSFFKPYGLLCFAESFVSPGLYLDKNQSWRRAGGHENKIDLSVFTAEIARNEPVTLFFQEFLAATLSPPTEFPTVG